MSLFAKRRGITCGVSLDGAVRRRESGRGTPFRRLCRGLGNCSTIQHDLDAALALVVSQQYRCVVLPSAGLGTGVAALQLHAPRTHAYLQAAVQQLRDSLDSML